MMSTVSPRSYCKVSLLVIVLVVVLLVVLDAFDRPFQAHWNCRSRSEGAIGQDLSEGWALPQTNQCIYWSITWTNGVCRWSSPNDWLILRSLTPSRSSWANSKASVRVASVENFGGQPPFCPFVGADSQSSGLCGLTGTLIKLEVEVRWMSWRKLLGMIEPSINGSWVMSGLTCFPFSLATSLTAAQYCPNRGILWDQMSEPSVIITKLKADDKLGCTHQLSST